MSLDFIYKKESDLDKENNFAINFSGKNRFNKNQFNKGEEYLISGLELIPQEVDLTQ